MKAHDFCYDGQYLSDYGFIIGTISDDDVITESNISQIVFNKMPRELGRKHTLTSTQYSETIFCEFQIFKNPDENESMIISNDEYRDLIHWLNRMDFHEMYFIDLEQGAETHYCNASFNIDKIMYNNNLIGLALEMETDSPLFRGQTVSYKWTATEHSLAFLLQDINDNVGYCYPDIEITANRAGNLEIYNDATNETTVIKNLSIDETIKIHGDTNIIETDNADHKKTLCNDFNFVFPKISNSIKSRNNKFSFSLPCTVKISYAPILK